MIQPFDLRLGGESYPIINGDLTITFDTPGDGFSCDITVDRNVDEELYWKVAPYQATPAEIYIEGELKLTGVLTKTARDKTDIGDAVRIQGYSNTIWFYKSKLKPSYQYNNRSMHSVAIVAGRQTDTEIIHPVKFDTEKSTAKFDKVTARRGDTAFSLVSPLAATRKHVISSTPQGAIILQQANIEKPSVGTIDETKTLIQTAFKGSWDLLNRPRELRVVSQTPKGPAQATTTDKNINTPLRELLVSYNALAGNIKTIADWELKNKVVDELTQEIPVIGFHAPDGSVWSTDTLLTLKSETLWIPDGFEYFIRAVGFMQRGDAKTALLSLIPKEVYTGEPVVEPWFQR